MNAFIAMLGATLVQLSDFIFVATLLNALFGSQQFEQACDLILATLSSVGKDFSLTSRTDAEITARAEGMADMFSAYVVALDAR